MLLNEQKALVQCYCLPGKTPTVKELRVLLTEALPYADAEIAHEMQGLLDALPQMTDADIAALAASTLPAAEPPAAPQR